MVRRRRKGYKGEEDERETIEGCEERAKGERTEQKLLRVPMGGM